MKNELTYLRCISVLIGKVLLKEEISEQSEKVQVTFSHY